MPTPPNHTILCRELTGSLTPREVFARLAYLPYCLFLDSPMRHATLGRYSFVMADPLRVHDDQRLPPSLQPGPWQETDPDLPPFIGGWAGLFGYELAHRWERLPRVELDEFQLPPVVLGYYDCVVAFDHLQDRAWMIAHAPEGPLHRGGPEAAARLDWLEALLEQPPRPRPCPVARPRLSLAPAVTQPVRQEMLSNFSADQYRSAVRRVIDYIRAGDVFQVNLSQRLLSPCDHDPPDLYVQLSDATPAPFGAYFDAGSFQVLSVSPERFLSVRGGKVEARPIKGTRRLTGTDSEDARMGRELQSDPKERAENTMIVDLLRNDLSRACEPDSVHVTQLCGLETYGYVQHLVSVVSGELATSATPWDLLSQAFPGGSVTGAPKVRAMEIITELERVARGPYCGAIGYLDARGNADSSILIRTATLAGGWLQIPVGGGIVADSDPDAEYEETWTKAAPFLRLMSDQAGGPKILGSY